MAAFALVSVASWNSDLSMHACVQRPREPINAYQYSIMQAVAKALQIPVIANGGSVEVKTYEEVLQFRVRHAVTMAA